LPHSFKHGGDNTFKDIDCALELNVPKDKFFIGNIKIQKIPLALKYTVRPTEVVPRRGLPLLLILRRGLPHLCIFVDFKVWATQFIYFR
jgi:hypothetical protein